MWFVPQTRSDRWSLPPFRSTISLVACNKSHPACESHVPAASLARYSLASRDEKNAPFTRDALWRPDSKSQQILHDVFGTDSKHLVGTVGEIEIGFDVAVDTVNGACVVAHAGRQAECR